MSLILKTKHNVNNYRANDYDCPLALISTIDESFMLSFDMDVIFTIIDDHTIEVHKEDPGSALSIMLGSQLITLSYKSSLVIDEETLKRSMINIVLSCKRHMSILDSTIICSCHNYGNDNSCSNIGIDCNITNSFVLMFPEYEGNVEGNVEEHSEGYPEGHPEGHPEDGIIKIDNESVLFIAKDKLKFNLKIPKIHLSSTLIGLIIKDIWIYEEGGGDILFKVKDENGKYKHFEVHGVAEYYSFSFIAFECILFIGNGGCMRIKRHDEVCISETEYEQRFLNGTSKIIEEHVLTVDATNDVHVKYIGDIINRIKFLKQFPDVLKEEQEFVEDIKSDILVVKPNTIVFTDIDTLLDTVVSVTIEENQTVALFESIKTLVPIEYVYDYLSSALMYIVVGYTDCSRFIGFHYPFSFSEFYSSDVLQILNDVELVND